MGQCAGQRLAALAAQPVCSVQSLHFARPLLLRWLRCGAGALHDTLLQTRTNMGCVWWLAPLQVFSPCMFVAKLGVGVGIVEAARMWPITFNMIATVGEGAQGRWGLVGGSPVIQLAVCLQLASTVPLMCLRQLLMAKLCTAQCMHADSRSTYPAMNYIVMCAA